MAVQQEVDRKARYLRVRVVDHTKEGEPAVNVRVPIRLVRFGLKMAERFSPDMKKAEIDWDAVGSMIDEGVVGELVHVEDEGEHKTVDVYVE